MMRFLALGAAALLAACAPKLYSWPDMRPERIEIAARSSVWVDTPTHELRAAVLLHAAKLTREAGYSHFRIVSAADTSISVPISMPGTAVTTHHGYSSVTTIYPATTIQARNGRWQATIEMLDAAAAAAFAESHPAAAWLVMSVADVLE